MKLALKLCLFSAVCGLLNFSGQKISRAETEEIDFESIEVNILDEINRARTTPSDYIESLVEFKTFYNGNRRQIPGEITIRTTEGVSAVDDAITYFENATPVDPLTLSAGMSQAAEDHVKDQGSLGEFGHTGSDGSKPSERMSRYGTWKRKAAENISYGPQTGEQVVIRLIVDDGVYARGHRRNIMSPLHKVVGIACGPHLQYPVMCVMTFAGGFEE
ncbi:MAG: CAP domain-containing protein [Cyanobacteria bacterium P01_H01_bin.15]